MAATGLFAQAQFSPEARQLLRRLDQSAHKQGGLPEFTPREKKHFLIKEDAEGMFVTGIMRVESRLDQQALDRLGIDIRTEIGDIMTVRVPLTSIPALKEVRGIATFELSRPMQKQLNAARADAGVDLVHMGEDLPRAYTGKSVVVGVIDAGFQYTHPTFLDSEGEKLRIARAWNQFMDENPPQGYDYGTEYTTEAELRTAVFDTDSATHGQHVAGIAVGSGYGTDGVYTGVAPGSEVVLVSGLLIETAAVLDAIQYIHDYARSKNLPCVINMSFGRLHNIMDGNSAYELALEQLVMDNQDLVLVAGAGNSGSFPIHLEHTFSGGDTVKTLLISLSPALGLPIPTGDTTDLDFVDSRAIIVTDPGVNFDIAFYTNSFLMEGQEITEIDFMPVEGDLQLDTLMAFSGLPGAPQDSILLSLDAYEVLEGSNRKVLFVSFENMAGKNGGFFNAAFFSIALRAEKGTIHMWNAAIPQGLPMIDRLGGDTPLPGYTVGDLNYSILTPATARGVIAVGAHTTTNAYLNILGDTVVVEDPALQEQAILNDRARFSSNGPTTDGRTRPTITAPGNVILSSVNNFEALTTATVDDTNTVYKEVINGDTSRYAAFEGTSMASPFVAGVVALMLEANPDLNAQQVRDILINTARTDEFTGDIPEQGSNQWGWGKVDAHSAVLEALNIVSVELREHDQHRSATLFPNPAQGKVTLNLTNYQQSDVQVQVLDLQGRVVHRSEVAPLTDSFSHTLALEGLAPGMYFVQVNDAVEQHSLRLVVR